MCCYLTRMSRLRKGRYNMATVVEETNEVAKENKTFFKIIIVGAGIAGISAANYLVQNGESDIKILEARDRIGGRVFSMALESGVVDLGASWIHGVLGNPVYELAVSNGLIQITGDHHQHSIVATTEDGKRVPISVIEEVYSAYFWFCKRCEEYYLLNLHPPPLVGNSVGKHLEMDIRAYLQKYEGEDYHVRRMVFDHLLNRETCITGCESMDETGLSDFGSYTELPGGNISIPGGFCSVIDFLASSLPRDSIELKAAVKNINWKNMSKKISKSVPFMENCVRDEQCKTLESNCMNNHNVAVECENGTIWHTDHLIITLPLGVLKLKAQDMFEPPLPDYKLECLEKLCFGVVDKIFLEYDRPFLNPEISEIITLWNQIEESDLSKTWYRKIYSFSRITENILLAWVSGREAEYLETLSFDQVGEICTQILRKFLNDPYVPKPCKVVCTSWKKQPYTLGSYTSIGIKGCQRDIDLLATPIYSDPYQSKPVLLFAGEATHSTFYSTTHGAYLSGRRSAEILLEPESTVSGSAVSSSTNDRTHGNTGDLSSWLRGIDLT